MVVFTSAWPSSSWIVRTLVAIFQKVRGERVPQAVTARVLVDTHLPHSLFHRSLYGRLIEMMPPLLPAPRIDRHPQGGEDILPAELARGVRVLALQRVGQPDLTPAGSEIFLVNATHPLDLRMQRLLEAVRKHGAAVLRPLPFANDEEPRRKVDVLDPQSQRLEKSQTSSVEDRGDEPWRPFHPRKQRPHFLARQNDRKLPGPACPNDVVDPRQRIVQDMTVQKHQGTERLRLSWMH